MPDIKNFEDFYALKVAPNAGRFRQEGESNDVWKIIMYISIPLTLFSLLVIMLNGTGEYSGAFVGMLIAFTLFSIYRFTSTDNRYVNDFKETVIKEIISYLHPGLVYKPGEMITEQEYRQSGLFRWRFEYYEGDDYIEGVYKNVSFHCSEIKTSIDVTRRSDVVWGMTKGADQYGVIFKGLFFTAKVNDAFTGGTYVWIRGKEQLGTSVADEEYRMFRFPRTVHVNTGNAMFDSVYSVYSTNPAEAHAIINNEMMDCLLRFRSQLGRNVVLSVAMGKCYVAIPMKEDLFEPGDTPDDKEQVKQHFFSVLLVLSIINQLQLQRLL